MEVFVLDDNDHDPVFVDGGTLKVLRQAEGTRVGSVVGRVTATDEDEGLNARLTYSLRPLDDSRDSALDVVADSGELVATTQFDYESRREYRCVQVCTGVFT